MKALTKKELASGIYMFNNQLGIATRKTEKEFVAYLLNGCGAMKPQKREELEAWYSNLLERITDRMHEKLHIA